MTIPEIQDLIAAVAKGFYVDKQGNPIEAEQWLKLISDDSYRVLKQDKLPMVRVSTFWFGLNPPLVFETMVFAADGSTADMERYATEREALDGHGRAIERWLAK